MRGHGALARERTQESIQHARERNNKAWRVFKRESDGDMQLHEASTLLGAGSTDRTRGTACGSTGAYALVLCLWLLVVRVLFALLPSVLGDWLGGCASFMGSTPSVEVVSETWPPEWNDLSEPVRVRAREAILAVSSMKTEDFLQILSEKHMIKEDEWHFGEYHAAAAAAVQEDLNLNKLVYKCVPRKLSESEFWRIYFSQVRGRAAVLLSPICLSASSCRCLSAAPVVRRRATTDCHL